MKNLKKLTLLVMIGLVLALSGCSNPAQSGSSDWTYADASLEMTAYSTGIMAAAVSTESTATSYMTMEGTDIEYHFNNYTDGTITINGSLSVTYDENFAMTIDGTLNFTGGSVDSIAYNNIRLSPMSGTLVITFNDGSTWSYNYATGAFSGI